MPTRSLRHARNHARRSGPNGSRPGFIRRGPATQRPGGTGSRGRARTPLLPAPEPQTTAARSPACEVATASSPARRRPPGCSRRLAGGAIPTSRQSPHRPTRNPSVSASTAPSGIASAFIWQAVRFWAAFMLRAQPRSHFALTARLDRSRCPPSCYSLTPLPNPDAISRNMQALIVANRRN